MMPRKDYERALDVLPGVCKELGLRFYGNENKWFESIGIGFESGTWCDIFVIDSFMGLPDETEAQKQIKLVQDKLTLYASDMRLSIREINERRKKLEKESITHGNTEYYYFLSPRTKEYGFFTKNTLFPIKRCPFEDTSLPFPNDASSVLRQWYGDYTKFPRVGVLHHGTAIVASYGDPTSTLKKLDSMLYKLKNISELQPKIQL